MRTPALLAATLLASQFAFAAATVDRTPPANNGAAEATLVRDEALANDPADRPPAGTQLAFVRDDQIYLVNADGSGLARLTNTGGGAANRDPAWSHDGQRIAFARENPGGGVYGAWDLHIMNADGSNVRRLTDNQGDDLFPVWRPAPRTPEP